MLSKMMFAAIRLVPSNSTHCATIPDFTPAFSAPAKGSISKAKELIVGPDRSDGKPLLLLWGLTLGVVSDFLEHIPPHNALELWTYPTFTSWDVRFVMWAMSYRFRSQKSLEMSSSTTAGEQDLPGFGSEAVGPIFAEGEGETAADGEQKPGEVGIAGLGVGRGWGQTGRAKMVARGAAVNSMLEGYYPIVGKAVATALAGRIGVVAFLAFIALRKADWRRLSNILT
jgi:hypothetical protein